MTKSTNLPNYIPMKHSSLNKNNLAYPSSTCTLASMESENVSLLKKGKTSIQSMLMATALIYQILSISSKNYLINLLLILLPMLVSISILQALTTLGMGSLDRLMQISVKKPFAQIYRWFSLGQFKQNQFLFKTLFYGDSAWGHIQYATVAKCIQSGHASFKLPLHQFMSFSVRIPKGKLNKMKMKRERMMRMII